VARETGTGPEAECVRSSPDNVARKGSAPYGAASQSDDRVTQETTVRRAEGWNVIRQRIGRSYRKPLSLGEVSLAGTDKRHSKHPARPDNEQGKEPSQAYR
jgi:hypothetical protein